jgi:hypothetical protein
MSADPRRGPRDGDRRARLAVIGEVDLAVLGGPFVGALRMDVDQNESNVSEDDPLVSSAVPTGIRASNVTAAPPDPRSAVKRWSTPAQRADGIPPVATPTATGGFSAWGTWPVVVGAFLLTVVALPTVGTTVDWAPEAAVALVVGVGGLPLLVSRAVGRRPERRSGTEMWAARMAVGFLLAGAVSTVLSVAPVLSTVGEYTIGTGLLFMAAVAGWWALGTGLSSRGRRLLENALLAGAAANAILAILQQLFGLGSIGLEGNNGQPDGFLGNPVHLGALLAGSLVLLAPRFRVQPRRWWPVVALIGTGVGVDGERFPALLTVVVVGWVAISARRQYRRDPTGGTDDWHRALVFGGVAIGTVLLGSLLAVFRGGLGVIRNTARSTSGETFGERLHAWGDAVHAIGVHPFLGSGPGLFAAAISPFYTLSEVRIDSSDLPRFHNAHNFVVEYATTTGIIGLVLLLAWLAFAARGRYGPLVGFAAVIGAVELVEPINIVNTPLAFVALGAALFGGRPSLSERAGAAEGADRGRTGRAAFPRWVGPTGLVLSLLAVIPATVLVIGDITLERGMVQHSRGDNTVALASASTANTLLAPWPDPAILVEEIHGTLAASGGPGQLEQTEHWARVALGRNPTDGALWSTLAQFQSVSGNQRGARQSALEAVKLDPWYAPALDVLGVTDTLAHNRGAAEHWFGRSLEAEPNQMAYREALTQLERGCGGAPGAGASHLVFVCPP